MLIERDRRALGVAQIEIEDGKADLSCKASRPTAAGRRRDAMTNADSRYSPET